MSTDERAAMDTAASRYRACGLACVPCVVHGKRPDFRMLRRTIGLRLLSRTWWVPVARLHDDPQQHKRWFQSACNIGLLTGVDDLLVLDFDERGSYERWRARNAIIAQSTATQRTFRGYHVFLRIPGGLPTSKLVMDGVVVGDVRASHAHVVVGPSLHPDGGRYEWVDGLAPWECGILFLESISDAGVQQHRRQTALRRWVRLCTVGFKHPRKLTRGCLQRFGRRPADNCPDPATKYAPDVARHCAESPAKNAVPHGHGV